MSVRWIAKESVTRIHSIELGISGGLAGVRDEGMVESALDRPRNREAYDETASVFDLAAAYGFGIARNHPFVDGNKRTALITTLLFLEKNGWEVVAEPADLYTAFYQLAAGELSEDELAAWLMSHARPLGSP